MIKIFRGGGRGVDGGVAMKDARSGVVGDHWGGGGSLRDLCKNI